MALPTQPAGRVFPTNAEGIEEAVAYIQSLHEREQHGIYVRGTTMHEVPAGERGKAGHTVAWLMLKADLDYGKTVDPDDLPYPPDANTVVRVYDGGVAAGLLPGASRWISSGHGMYPGLLDEPCTDNAAMKLLGDAFGAAVTQVFHTALVQTRQVDFEWRRRAGVAHPRHRQPQGS